MIGSALSRLIIFNVSFGGEKDSARLPVFSNFPRNIATSSLVRSRDAAGLPLRFNAELLHALRRIDAVNPVAQPHLYFLACNSFEKMRRPPKPIRNCP
jgi:hypothetical protein